MKNLLRVVICLVAMVSASLMAQTNATKNQSAMYGNWVAHSTNTISSGAQTIVPDFCYYNATVPPVFAANPGAITGSTHQFFPFATNAAVTIVDGANTETVTPSSVVSPAAN